VRQENAFGALHARTDISYSDCRDVKSTFCKPSRWTYSQGWLCFPLTKLSASV